MGCCGRAGHAGWPKGDCLQGWGITQKPGSRSAGKEANGVSKALLRRVNHERGEVAYRAGGETAEEHRALVVSSHLELELELELAHPHIAHRTCHMRCLVASTGQRERRQRLVCSTHWQCLVEQHGLYDVTHRQTHVHPLALTPQSLHSPFRLQGGGVRLHLFLAASRGV